MAGNGGTRRNQGSSSVPSELQDAAKISDVDALGEKVQKCYSQDRYEEFQGAVEKITLKTLDATEGRKKVKELAKESAKEYSEDQGWKNKQFWIPVVVSLIGLGVAIFAAFKA